MKNGLKIDMQKEKTVKFLKGQNIVNQSHCTEINGSGAKL